MDAVAAIALSGLNTASQRMQVSASNLANMNDAAPLAGSGVAGPAPFVPTRADPVSLGAGGVQAQLTAVQPGSAPAYAPDSPYADSAGMVSLPDVDPTRQMVELTQALQQYRAAAALLDADNRLQGSALKMLR
jgi:flagellar basal-body rod protein FlgC